MSATRDPRFTPPDRGHRGNLARRHPGHVARGGAAVRVPHQVHLGRAGDGQDGLHLCQQLLAAHLGAVGGRHLGHVDLGAALAQRVGDAVEVVDAQGRVKAEKAVHQHDGVARLGVARLRLRAHWPEEQQCDAVAASTSRRKKRLKESGHVLVSVGMVSLCFTKKNDRSFFAVYSIFLFSPWSHYRDIPEFAIQPSRETVQCS